MFVHLTNPDCDCEECVAGGTLHLRADKIVAIELANDDSGGSDVCMLRSIRAEAWKVRESPEYVMAQINKVLGEKK